MPQEVCRRQCLYLRRFAKPRFVLKERKSLLAESEHQYFRLETFQLFVKNTELPSSLTHGRLHK